jgi:hypothetical protein
VARAPDTLETFIHCWFSTPAPFIRYAAMNSGDDVIMKQRNFAGFLIFDFKYCGIASLYFSISII